MILAAVLRRPVQAVVVAALHGSAVVAAVVLVSVEEPLILWSAYNTWSNTSDKARDEDLHRTAAAIRSVQFAAISRKILLSGLVMLQAG